MYFFQTKRGKKILNTIFIIGALVGGIGYGIYKKWIEDDKKVNIIQPPTIQNRVDSGTLNNIQNNRDVFQNSGGQQFNNTDSGQQNIIIK